MACCAECAEYNDDCPDRLSPHCIPYEALPLLLTAECEAFLDRMRPLLDEIARDRARRLEGWLLDGK